MTGANPDIHDLALLFEEMAQYPVSGEVRIKYRDGRAVIARLSDGDRESTLREIAYSFSSGVIRFESLRGDRFEVEPETEGARTDHRPVVYLDQCHWSTISNSIFDPALIRREEDRDAAAKLIDLAERREVIIPVSSAHALETSALFDSKRQNLASTILRLSRGWQMRSPIVVRMKEMADALVRRSDVSPHESELDVFTLAAGAMDTNRRISDASGLPPGMAALFERMTSFSAIYDVLMNPEKVPSAKTGWHEHYNNVSRDPEFQARKASQKIIDGRAMAIADVAPEAIAVAQSLGITSVERLSVTLYEEIESMPFMRLYGDAIGHRLAIRANWEANDLVDMLYLGCAAAYADVVVAERAATNYLQRAWRGTEAECPVVAKLPKAVDRLSHLLS
ncbi:hypothetical protein N8I84_26955 [Streptomyces cynarae]|uniref:DUF4388 domain-containing protein n=1 Tax=Streptomyces cynarae TaxID=2981134 RepID=A0ABY6E5L8_9ACTN|nr:hypothetical protein [Streptomyces cynarae]UXY21934.1 hypothetical protein N8I84_26955 [Streptomyces cynarae]